MGYELYERQEQYEAEAMLAVEHDNAEIDAIEGTAPNWELFEKDRDYRRRYYMALLEAIYGDVSEVATKKILALYQQKLLRDQIAVDGLALAIDEPF